MRDGVVITLAIVLPEVRRVRRVIGFTVVSASEDAVDAVLVEDIGVEEDAQLGCNARGCVASVVRAYLLARQAADGWVVWLGGQEGLHAHVRAGGRRSDDGRIAQRDGAGEVGDRLWGKGVGVRAGDHDVEFVLVLADVGGISDRDGGTVEGALNTGDGARVGTVDAVEVESWVTLEVCRRILAFAFGFNGDR